jgi:hypothetical protein
MQTKNCAVTYSTRRKSYANSLSRRIADGNLKRTLKRCLKTDERRASNSAAVTRGNNISRQLLLSDAEMCRGHVARLITSQTAAKNVASDRNFEKYFVGMSPVERVKDDFSGALLKKKRCIPAAVR